MSFLRLLLPVIIGGLALIPVSAFAQMSDGVNVTASGNVSTGCPSHLIITAVTDYEIILYWNPVINSTTMVRTAYGRPPSNTTDGFLLCEGNVTTATHWVNSEFFTVPIYYRAWANFGNSTYSDCYAETSLPAGANLEEIAAGLTSLSGQVENIWDILSLFSLFLLPLICTLAYQWKGSIIFAVLAFMSAWLALPYVANYGWHFAGPMMLLGIFVILKLLHQAFKGGFKV